MSTTLAISDIAHEAKRDQLRTVLGDHPETIPCNVDDHPPRPIDVSMLNYGAVRYLPCPACHRRRRWVAQGIPDRLADESGQSYEVTNDGQRLAHRIVREWIRGASRGDPSGTFLLLCGNPGTGKSHLATAALKALGGGWFVTAADLFRLRSEHYDDKRNPDPVARAKHARCLVIDEITIGDDRADAPEVWDRILGSRYDTRRPTVLASNSGANTILDRIGLPGIRDRIRTDAAIVAFRLGEPPMIHDYITYEGVEYTTPADLAMEREEVEVRKRIEEEAPDTLVEQSPAMQVQALWEHCIPYPPYPPEILRGIASAAETLGIPTRLQRFANAPLVRLEREVAPGEVRDLRAVYARQCRALRRRSRRVPILKGVALRRGDSYAKVVLERIINRADEHPMQTVRYFMAANYIASDRRLLLWPKQTDLAGLCGVRNRQSARQWAAAVEGVLEVRALDARERRKKNP